MNFQKQLRNLIAIDEVVHNLPKIEALSSHYDDNHLARRLQQRAINWDMIKLAIAYGKFQYFSQAKTWTILDKDLRFTPYQKFIDRLRGLRIIASNYYWDTPLRLSTAYWTYSIRK